jgi:uncharacterized integral membrane protein
MADDSDGMQSGDKEYTDKGKSFGAIISVIVGVAALVFIFQNSEQQEVNFLFFSATVPLSVVIIISMVLGAVIGGSFGYMRRRRRRRRD